MTLPAADIVQQEKAYRPQIHHMKQGHYNGKTVLETKFLVVCVCFPAVRFKKTSDIVVSTATALVCFPVYHKLPHHGFITRTVNHNTSLPPKFIDNYDVSERPPQI